MSKTSTSLFPHPFSRAYWRTALAEFRNTRVLIFAALMIALRVIFKTVSIPIGMDLRINTAFLINAFGAMVFGPVVAIAAAAITDTLGCLLFPTGPYFFPFIFPFLRNTRLYGPCRNRSSQRRYPANIAGMNGSSFFLPPASLYTTDAAD